MYIMHAHRPLNDTCIASNGNDLMQVSRVGACHRPSSKAVMGVLERLLETVLTFSVQITATSHVWRDAEAWDAVRHTHSKFSEYVEFLLSGE